MAFILIIDDEEESRDLAQGILGIAKHQVLGVDNWEEGRQIIMENDLDLVLLDVNMPDIAGQQVLQVLRETIAKLPKIVFYSGRNTDQLQKLTREHNAHGFIQKGNDIQSLINKVEDFLDMNHGDIIRDFVQNTLEEKKNQQDQESQG